MILEEETPNALLTYDILPEPVFLRPLEFSSSLLMNILPSKVGIFSFLIEEKG